MVSQAPPSTSPSTAGGPTNRSRFLVALVELEERILGIPILAPVRPHWSHARKKLERSSLAQRLAKGAAWSLIGAVSTRVLALLTSIFVVRLLGKERMGEYGMVLSTLAMLGTFAGLGLGLTATKHTAELRTKNPERVGRVLTLVLLTALIGGLVAATLGIMMAEQIAARILERPSLAPYLRLTSIMVMIGALEGVFSATLAGFEAFRSIARRSIFVSAMNPLIMLPLVFFYGLYGAFLGLLASAATQMTLDGLAVRRECRKHGVHLRLDRECRTEWRVLLHFALPALAANILVIPAMWLGHVILVRSEFGYPALGVVDVVNTLRTLAIYLPTVLLAPTFAILSNVSSDAASVRMTLRYAIGMAALLVFPTAIVITSLSKYVLLTLYGTEFAQEGTTLAFAMAVVAVQATGMPLGNYLSAMGRMWLCLSINLLWGVAFIGISLILVPKYGQVGYMGSMALAYLINMIVVYGGFYLKMPHLMQSYPLVRALALFGVMMPMAMYVNVHFNMASAVVCAALLGGGLAIALAAPLAKGNLYRAPVAAVANASDQISRSDD